jgi:hypothetical protein
MTNAQYLAAIARLNLSQVAAGKMLGLSPRQAQRIASGDSPVSKPVEKLLTLIVRLRLKPEDVPK